MDRCHDTWAEDEVHLWWCETTLASILVAWRDICSSFGDERTLCDPSASPAAAPFFRALPAAGDRAFACSP